MQVLMDEVEGVDTAARLVFVKDTATVLHDVLILATGSVYSWFGHDAWKDNSVALRTLDDASTLRRRLLGAFERAESRTDAEEIRALLTLVVVGGGPTGVELAGAIAELARSTLVRDYRHIDPASTRVVICEAGPRLLAELPEALSAYAERKLRALGVEIRTGETVQDVRPDGISAAGLTIRAANVFWCAGTEATPAARWVNARTGRHGRRGQSGLLGPRSAPNLCHRRRRNDEGGGRQAPARAGRGRHAAGPLPRACDPQADRGTGRAGAVPV
jgi:NADH dehydrogenase